MNIGVETTAALKPFMTAYTYFVKNKVIITASGTQVPGIENVPFVASQLIRLSLKKVYPTTVARTMAIPKRSPVSL